MGNVKADEKIKAWITKYALSEGIHVVDGVVCHNISSTMLKYGRHGYAHGKDWHRTQDEAIKRAEENCIDKEAISEAGRYDVRHAG